MGSEFIEAEEWNHGEQLRSELLDPPLNNCGKYTRSLPWRPLRRRRPTAFACFPGAGIRYLVRVSNHIGTNIVTGLVAYVFRQRSPHASLHEPFSTPFSTLLSALRY